MTQKRVKKKGTGFHPMANGDHSPRSCGAEPRASAAEAPTSMGVFGGVVGDSPPAIPSLSAVTSEMVSANGPISVDNVTTEGTDPQSRESGTRISGMVPSLPFPSSTGSGAPATYPKAATGTTEGQIGTMATATRGPKSAPATSGHPKSAGHKATTAPKSASYNPTSRSTQPARPAGGDRGASSAKLGSIGTWHASDYQSGLSHNSHATKKPASNSKNVARSKAGDDQDENKKANGKAGKITSNLTCTLSHTITSIQDCARVAVFNNVRPWEYRKYVNYKKGGCHYIWRSMNSIINANNLALVKKEAAILKYLERSEHNRMYEEGCFCSNMSDTVFSRVSNKRVLPMPTDCSNTPFVTMKIDFSAQVAGGQGLLPQVVVECMFGTTALLGFKTVDDGRARQSTTNENIDLTMPNTILWYWELERGHIPDFQLEVALGCVYSGRNVFGGTAAGRMGGFDEGDPNRRYDSTEERQGLVYRIIPKPGPRNSGVKMSQCIKYGVHQVSSHEHECNDDNMEMMIVSKLSDNKMHPHWHILLKDGTLLVEISSEAENCIPAAGAAVMGSAMDYIDVYEIRVVGMGYDVSMLTAIASCFREILVLNAVRQSDGKTYERIINGQQTSSQSDSAGAMYEKDKEGTRTLNHDEYNKAQIANANLKVRPFVATRDHFYNNAFLKAVELVGSTDAGSSIRMLEEIADQIENGSLNLERLSDRSDGAESIDPDRSDGGDDLASATNLLAATEARLRIAREQVVGVAEGVRPRHPFATTADGPRAPPLGGSGTRERNAGRQSGTSAGSGGIGATGIFSSGVARGSANVPFGSAAASTGIPPASPFATPAMARSSGAPMVGGLFGPDGGRGIFGGDTDLYAGMATFQAALRQSHQDAFPGSPSSTAANLPARASNRSTAMLQALLGNGIDPADLAAIAEAVYEDANDDPFDDEPESPNRRRTNNSRAVENMGRGFQTVAERRAFQTAREDRLTRMSLAVDRATIADSFGEADYVFGSPVFARGPSDTFGPIAGEDHMPSDFGTPQLGAMFTRQNSGMSTTSSYTRQMMYRNASGGIHAAAGAGGDRRGVSPLGNSVGQDGSALSAAVYESDRGSNASFTNASRNSARAMFDRIQLASESRRQDARIAADMAGMDEADIGTRDSMGGIRRGPPGVARGDDLGRTGSRPTGSLGLRRDYQTAYTVMSKGGRTSLQASANGSWNGSENGSGRGPQNASGRTNDGTAAGRANENGEQRRSGGTGRLSVFGGNVTGSSSFLPRSSIGGPLGSIGVPGFFSGGNRTSVAEDGQPRIIPTAGSSVSYDIITGGNTVGNPPQPPPRGGGQGSNGRSSRGGQ